jgi:hypothetical protein
VSFNPGVLKGAAASGATRAQVRRQQRGKTDTE